MCTTDAHCTCTSCAHRTCTSCAHGTCTSCAHRTCITCAPQMDMARASHVYIARAPQMHILAPHVHIARAPHVHIARACYTCTTDAHSTCSMTASTRPHKGGADGGQWARPAAKGGEAAQTKGNAQCPCTHKQGRHARLVVGRRGPRPEAAQRRRLRVSVQRARTNAVQLLAYGKGMQYA